VNYNSVGDNMGLSSFV